MTAPDDLELLADFARTASEEAFAELVTRHVNLVYSAALRCTDNPHSATEITQAVFIILARKAEKLSARVVLSGWLYQTARLTAANFVKGEVRRQQREQEAYMQSTLNENDPAAWLQVAPLLDEAMGQLGETDRTAVVLRYFENKTAQEVGAALKLTEAAAHKRVNRALEKLRKIFTKRGVTLSAVVIAGAVAANSVQAAPAGLVISTVAAIKGSAATVSTLTLVKGTLKIMTYAKLKLALAVSTAILLAGGAVTVALSSGGAPNDGVSAAEIFKKAQDTYASLTSYSDEGKSVAILNGTTITDTFTIRLARPELYRIDWQQSTASAAYNSTTAPEAVWSAGAGHFGLNSGGSSAKYKDRETALSSATGISGGAAATVPGTFFKMNWGNQLGGSIAGEKRVADEKAGGVDCYVFTSTVSGRVKTIWIGKQDYLIHQVRTFTSAATMKAMMAENAKRYPEIAARLPKMEYTDNTATETHENIVLNQKFTAADFTH